MSAVSGENHSQTFPGFVRKEGDVAVPAVRAQLALRGQARSGSGAGRVVGEAGMLFLGSLGLPLG